MTEREQIEAAKKKVRNEYPGAFWNGFRKAIQSSTGFWLNGYPLDRDWSEDQAWLDAASRLPVPVEPKAQVSRATFEKRETGGWFPKAQVESASVEEDPCKMTDAQYEAYIYGPDRAKWPTNESEMTNAELDAELRANGIDPHELNKKMLARIREEKAAGKSGPMMDAAERQFEAAVKEVESGDGLLFDGMIPLSLDQITPEIRLLASRCILASDKEGGAFSKDAHKYAAYTIIRERQLTASLLREKGLRDEIEDKKESWTFADEEQIVDLREQVGRLKGLLREVIEILMSKIEGE